MQIRCLGIALVPLLLHVGPSPYAVFPLIFRRTQLRENGPVTRIGHIDMGPAKVKKPAVSPAVVASPDCSARQWRPDHGVSSIPAGRHVVRVC
ncbi:hypothetical protein P3T31_000486 [Rhizobium sp. AN70]|nr:hypothetical protein [Rhizobium sp. AN70]